MIHPYFYVRKRSNGGLILLYWNPLAVGSENEGCYVEPRLGTLKENLGRIVRNMNERRQL